MTFDRINLSLLLSDYFFQNFVEHLHFNIAIFVHL